MKNNNTKIILTFALLCLFAQTLVYAQTDPTLFTVNGKNVTVSEFAYIYGKTNPDKANYTEASLREYLELYSNFKLKVEKARDMKIDTIASLQQELDGYREQLSETYLIDKQVRERLVKEAYERKKNDVEISHILISIPRGSSDQDTLVPFKKAMEIKAKLDAGEKFEDLVKTHSEDQYSKNIGGKIGFVTALLPNGFYRLENAAYNTPQGKYSNPVRTDLGYHIVRVDNKRPARGLIEVAHVFARNKKESPLSADTLIQKAFAALKSGKSFDQTVTDFSEDTKTNKQGGRIGIWGISSTEPAILDAVYNLKKDGEYTAPIKSSVGWHIIKRISKIDLQSYDLEKGKLQNQIESDGRFVLAREAIIEKIKRDNKYTIDGFNFQNFKKTLDNSFITYQWKAPEAAAQHSVFTLGNEAFSLNDFVAYLAANARERVQVGLRTKDIGEVANIMLDKFASERALEFEKKQLADKYPDFKSLMREYEEGILLFEVTKMNVWDKASRDSLGLVKYYDAHKDKYKWGSKAKMTKYTIQSQSADILNKVRKAAKKSNPEAVLAKMNKSGKLVTVEAREAEEGKVKELEKMPWKKGTISSNVVNEDNSVSFYKIESTEAPRPKTLAEAKGYVVADYQDQLEKQWVQELRKSYKVEVNEKILKSLIK